MIDYVLPYVDCEDPIWREQYKQVGFLSQMDASRFRPFDTLRYVFRSVAVNLPWIDRVVLIVSTDSQVPEWVNRDRVRVVTHKEFMPQKHLPTFNSSVIESWMWRIEGLTDRFIYANDDFFVLRPLDESAFFDGDKPRLHFEESDFSVQNLFRRCCRNGMDMAADALGVDRTDGRVLLKPQHCQKGINTAQMRECGRKIEPKIDATITTERHWFNFTGYIYQYYAYYTGEYSEFTVPHEYIRIKNDYTPIISAIERREKPLLCINDAGELDTGHYTKAVADITTAFEDLFPKGCKYEQ